MNKIFASLLVFIYVTMSVVAHGMPYQVPNGADRPEAKPVNGVCLVVSGFASSSCESSSKDVVQCESLHCAFHFIFLNQVAATYDADDGKDHLEPIDEQLVALLPEFEKKPPRNLI